MFALHPTWSDVVRIDKKGWKFRQIPTYAEVVATSQRLFSITEIFPYYEIRGLTAQGSEYALNEVDGELIFEKGCEIHIVPRYFTAEFNISTWAEEFSRAAVQRICKNRGVSGSVTRDNINSILVTLSHPDGDLVTALIDELEAIVATRDGTIHTAVHRWEWGTLDNTVRKHRGTATRDDGVRSWEDEDAKSGSTYFNVPNPSRYRKKID